MGDTRKCQSMFTKCPIDFVKHFIFHIKGSNFIGFVERSVWYLNIITVVTWSGGLYHVDKMWYSMPDQDSLLVKRRNDNHSPGWDQFTTVIICLLYTFSYLKFAEFCVIVWETCKHVLCFVSWCHNSGSTVSNDAWKCRRKYWKPTLIWNRKLRVAWYRILYFCVGKLIVGRLGVYSKMRWPITTCH